ncbi:hypothetical protein ABT158_42280 [Nonomuraea sp. NPDC001636]|uniref:hypothetical protein n=1 Tax=Nonomuraea sp. NPDC001636 TaxID=3154391 RepID=UPI003317D7C3
MRTLTGLCDRLVARLVPEVTAAAAGCWVERKNGLCRRCCDYGDKGVRCNGWSTYCL